jgi:hypothetical protein
MNIKPYEELQATLEKAELQARGIFEKTGQARPLLDGIRACANETRNRIRAYQQHTRPAPKSAPSSPAPAKPDSNKVNGAKRPGIQEQIKPEEGGAQE